MHYRNGREAKQGDIVVNTENNLAGNLHHLNAGSTTCNGRLSPIGQNDAWVTLSECVHMDDVIAAFPDRTKAVEGPKP